MKLAGMDPPPRKPVSFFTRIRAASGNPFETLPLAAYQQPIYESESILGRVLVVSDSDSVRRVLLENVANYPKNEMEIRFFSAMFGEGLLSAGAEKWRTHRRIMAPSFGARSVAAYAPVMADTAVEFAAGWAKLPPHTEIDIAEEMKALTLKIICRTMFSSDAEELAALADDALDFVQSTLKFGLLDALPVIGPLRIKGKQEAIRDRFARMDTAIYRLIGEREKKLDSAPNDLLTRLIAAKDPDNGAGLNASEVRDEVITIFMAGHETTAVTMTWVWYLVSQHPEVAARLRAEIHSVLGGRAPATEDVPKLGYARMIVEEAMRMYPPAPGFSVRQAVNEDELCGVKVAAGTQVLIAPWVLHRHQLYWDRPEVFDPERFSAERSEHRPRYAYLPFGGGPRICIGATLAITEAVVILAVLAQQFRLDLVPGQTIKLLTRITLRPQHGIKMTLEPVAPVS
jgi:cytochrome P450